MNCEAQLLHPDGRISGFVVTYNREDIVETCLRSIRFVDELIVIDKSSMDQTAAIAREYADKVVVTDWSPTVEGSRELALSHCSHDAIVFLDDDECFSAEAIAYLNTEMRKPDHSLIYMPCRQHILGQHDEQAYYWPERHIRAFRRGALEFLPTVHAGQRVISTDAAAYPELDSGICYHNISHANTEVWIEKANRYTSQKNRSGMAIADPEKIADSARESFDYWTGKCTDTSPPYVQAVALLRCVYDLIDIVKRWENHVDLQGNAMLMDACKGLNRDYDALEHRSGIRTSKR